MPLMNFHVMGESKSLLINLGASTVASVRLRISAPGNACAYFRTTEDRFELITDEKLVVFPQMLIYFNTPNRIDELQRNIAELNSTTTPTKTVNKKSRKKKMKKKKKNENLKLPEPISEIEINPTLETEHLDVSKVKQDITNSINGANDDHEWTDLDWVECSRQFNVNIGVYNPEMEPSHRLQYFREGTQNDRVILVFGGGKTYEHYQLISKQLSSENIVNYNLTDNGLVGDYCSPQPTEQPSANVPLLSITLSELMSLMQSTVETAIERSNLKLRDEMTTTIETSILKLRNEMTTAIATARDILYESMLESHVKTAFLSMGAPVGDESYYSVTFSRSKEREAFEKLESWSHRENYNQWLSLLPKDMSQRLTLAPDSIEINFCSDPSKLRNQKTMAFAAAVSPRFYPLSKPYHNFSVDENGKLDNGWIWVKMLLQIRRQFEILTYIYPKCKEFFTVLVSPSFSGVDSDEVLNNVLPKLDALSVRYMGQRNPLFDVFSELQQTGHFLLHGVGHLDYD
jgi:hypothetical protein